MALCLHCHTVGFFIWSCLIMCIKPLKLYTKTYKSLTNAKRPCNCRVLCLCLKSSLCSCAHYFRHDIIRLSWPKSWQCVPSALNVYVKKFKKARVDGGSNHGNQTISSTWLSCWIQISTTDAINIAADHQMFMILTGELSCQHLRRSAVDFTQKTKKSLFQPRFLVRTSPIARWKARGRLYIRRNWTTVETLWAEIGRSRRFSKGVGQFERIFQRERGIANQLVLVSEN